jgi:hypothetical protein
VKDFIEFLFEKYDEKKHPRVPKGAIHAGQWMNKIRSWWQLTQDTGDEWNQSKSAQLAIQYTKVKPLLEKLAKSLVGGYESVVKKQPEEWNDLSETQQKAVKESWKVDNFSSFMENEIENWYQSGDALRQAQYEVHYNWEQNNGTDYWLDEAIDKAFEEYRQTYDKEIPYFMASIKNAVKLELYDKGDIYDLLVDFDKEHLQNPKYLIYDPKNQLELPDIKHVNPGKHLTVDMKSILYKHIKDAFKKVTENLSFNSEHPEYLKESAEEYMDQYFDDADDEYKFEKAVDYGVVKKNETPPDILDKLPNLYLPLGGKEYSTEEMADYKRTKTLSHLMFTERAAQILKERGLTDNVTDEDELRSFIRDYDKDLWKDWKDSSTSQNGFLIQLATSEELGGRFHNYKKIYKNLEDAKKDGDLDFKYIGGYEGIKALMRAKWETSQYLLDKAKVKEVSVYRSVSMDLHKTTNPSIPKPPHIKGQQVEVQRLVLKGGEVFGKLPDAVVLRNGASSTTLERSVANGWNHYNQVVVRIVAPRTAVLSLPCYGINVHHEREVVLAGTSWKAWDAWSGPAPNFNQFPIGSSIVPLPTKEQEKPMTWAEAAKKYADQEKANLLTTKVPVYIQAADLVAKLAAEGDDMETMKTKVKEFMEDAFIKIGYSKESVPTSITLNKYEEMLKKLFHDKAAANVFGIFLNIQKMVDKDAEEKEKKATPSFTVAQPNMKINIKPEWVEAAKKAQIAHDMKIGTPSK